MDEEMRARIEQHQTRRPNHWSTMENRFDLENQILESANTLLWLTASRCGFSYHSMQGRPPGSILADLEAALRRHANFGGRDLRGRRGGNGMVAVTQEGRVLGDLCGRPTS